MARTSCRSVGSKCARKPAPPVFVPPSEDTSTSPSTDHEICPLVHLVVLQLLASGQRDGDHARLVVGAKHLRMVRLDVE